MGNRGGSVLTWAGFDAETATNIISQPRPMSVTNNTRRVITTSPMGGDRVWRWTSIPVCIPVTSDGWIRGKNRIVSTETYAPSNASNIPIYAYGNDGTFSQAVPSPAIACHTGTRSLWNPMSPNGLLCGTYDNLPSAWSTIQETCVAPLSRNDR